MSTRAVILAAGRSLRMGGEPKLLMPYLGMPMIEYALHAAYEWNPLVIASPAVASYLENRKHVAYVVNETPERGMSHSLKLADRMLPAHAALLVLLGDKPQVTAELLRAVERAGLEADVAHPQRGEEPGHPVYFSPLARTRIAALPAGDSLQLLREDPSLRHARLTIESGEPYFDIDLPGAAERARE